MHLGKLLSINKWELQMNYIGRYLQHYYDRYKVEKKGLYKGQPRDKKIIVSLTSFPKRFDTLHICIRSIFNQTVKADSIILYLDEEVNLNNIPDSLKTLQKDGLKIVKRPGNIKPHKKYYYAIKEHPDDIVITVDDDMIYERNLIKHLLQSYKRYPNAVSAKRVHQILADGQGKILPYNDWLFEYKKDTRPRTDLFVTGIGGVLYPPHCLPDETFDIDTMLQLSANNDDIWLKFMQIISGTKVVYVPGRWIHPCCMMETQEVALSHDNVEQNRNDEYIHNMEEYYSINLTEYL